MSAVSTTVAGVTDPDYLSTTRDAYDAVAQIYAAQFSDSLREQTLERGMLQSFAELLISSGNPAVADLGCGPGHVTAHLRGLGLEPFGVDLSPAMIALARAAHPALRFTTGSMTALDLPDGGLGGVLSRFSLIHTPPAQVPGILAEFHRVLAPGGHLLLGFYGTDGSGYPTQDFDHKVATAYRWWPDHLATLLSAVGLTATARMVLEPQPTDRRQFQTVFLLAQKPAD